MAHAARLPLMVIALAIGLLLIAPVWLARVSLALVAGLTDRISRSLDRRPEPLGWRQLVEYAPEVGWRPRPGLDGYGQADDAFHLTIGPDGWRGHLPLEEADVVVFGDSFALGHGADDHAVFTQFCGDVRVKAIGSDGYDMVHGLLWMRRLAPALAGKLVVWFVYYGNDLQDNLQPDLGGDRKPFVRLRPQDGQWELMVEHVSREPWPSRSPTDYQRHLAEFCCDTSFSRRAFSACEFLIREAKQVCDAQGAELIMAGVPDRTQLHARGQAHLRRLAPGNAGFDPMAIDKRLGSLCESIGLRFLPLSSILKASDYLVSDIHWRTSGNRKVGRAIRQLFLDGPRPIPVGNWAN
jgi:hypothetical protein